MIFLSNRVRILVATQPVDFLKGHDGLAALVQSVLRKDPLTGTVFVFRSSPLDWSSPFWAWPKIPSCASPQAAGGAIASPLRRAAARAADGVGASHAAGARGAFAVSGGKVLSAGGAEVATASDASSPSSSSGGPPGWARNMSRAQTLRQGATMTAHAIRAGDSHGSGSAVNLSQKDPT